MNRTYLTQLRPTNSFGFFHLKVWPDEKFTRGNYIFPRLARL